MKFSRRDFLLAGASIAVMSRADAWLMRGRGGALAATTTEYRFYCFQPSQHSLFAMRSTDLNTWVNFGVRFTPISGTTVRDPSVIKVGSTYWLVNTSAPAANEFSSVNFFSLSSSVDDGVTFTNPVQISCSSVAGSGTGARCWAPTWFQDDDGSLHVIVSLSSDATNFALYILAFNSTSGTFGSPTQITGTGFPSDTIDGTLISPANSPNGKYNLFYKNDTTKFIEYSSSSSRASGYTVTQSGNWAGWGSPLESPNLQKLPNGNWRIWLDAEGSGYTTSDSSDGWVTWSAKTALLSPFVPQHGGIVSQQTTPLLTSIPSRSVINVQSLELSLSYAFINHTLSTGPLAFIGGGGAGAPPLNTLIDKTTGYGNNPSISGHDWGVSVSVPKSADFHGPWVLAWKGDGKIDANWNVFPTWTEGNGSTAAATINIGNPSITATQSWATFIGMKVVSGTTVGNIVAGTTYYVCSGTTGSVLKLSTTFANAKAGTAITPSGSGSATITPKGQGSYTKNSNGVWTANQTSTSSDCYIVFNGGATDFSTPVTAANTHLIVKLTGGTNGFVSNVRWYRLEDEDDLLAGNIFRTPLKQELVSLNPGAIRFMNWTGGNKDINCRWENRLPPTMGSYSSTLGAGPTYLASTASVPNQFVVAAATGTPTSMQHGEVAQFDNLTSTRATTGYQTVTAINPTGGGSTTARATVTAHGFQVGDWVIHTTSGGMPHLNLFPVQITAVTANTYDFANAAGAGLGTFSAGQVLAYVTLKVGSGSDRTAYPIMFAGNSYYAATFGNPDSFTAGTRVFHFDKNLIGSFDGSGNPLRGAWIMNDTDFGTVNGVPVEICVALVNEVNALSVSQGITTPVNIWLNCPYRGLLSLDPDYSSGSNWATNTINVALNGNTAGGVTYAGLTAAASIFFEYSNEIWNRGKSDFPGDYLVSYGAARWYPTSYPSGGNFVDAHAIRATCMARDIKAAFPGNARVQTVLGCQAAGGFAQSSQNFLTAYGDPVNSNSAGNFYSTDSVVVAGSWNTPITNLDHVCIAPYIDASATYWSRTTGTGTFTDDSAKYNGTNNSGNGGGNYTGAANQSAAITGFVTAIGNYTNDGGPGTLDYTQSGGFFDQFSWQLSIGKGVLNYEGGKNWPDKASNPTWNGHTITTADDAFILGVMNSSALATAQTSLFNDFVGRFNCRMPALYLWENANTVASTGVPAYQWAYTSPDAYASGTEGQGLLNNPTWVAVSTRNRALTV